MKRSSESYWKEKEGKFRSALIRVVTVVSLFFIMSGGVHGETPNSGKLILSMEQMIRMTVTKSPEMAEIRSEVAGARSDLSQAEAAYYPQIDSITLVGPVNNDRRPIIRGNGISDPSPDLSPGVFGSTDLVMTQPIYTFGKLSNRREAASRGVTAVELKLLQKENETALRVKELYYALVLARTGIDAAAEALTYFDEARARMKRLLDLKSSNVVESDLYKVDAYVANILRSRAEAQKGSNIAYFALKSLLQLPPGTEFEPAEKVLPVKEEGLRELDAYVKKALQDRPELKQLDEAVAARKSSVEAAHSDLYPSFFASLTGSLAGAPGRETLHNPYITDQFNHAYVGVVGGMSWHFDFGIMRGRIDKERSEYERLLHARATGRLNIPIEVAKYYQEVIEFKAAVDAYEKGTVASRKWVVAALANFDMGIGTADEMLRGMEKYGENQGKYLEALFNYNMAQAKLECVTGMRSW